MVVRGALATGIRNSSRKVLGLCHQLLVELILKRHYGLNLIFLMLLLSHSIQLGIVILLRARRDEVIGFASFLNGCLQCCVLLVLNLESLG